MLAVLGTGGYVALSRIRDSDGGPADPTTAPPAAAPLLPATSLVWSPGPPAGKVVVTRAMAEDVLTRYWPAHAQALRDHDRAALAQLNGGAARSWEDGAVACNCIVTANLRPLRDAAFHVPRQTTYPARFVVDALTAYSNGNEGVEVLVFSRSDRRAPWLVIENSAYGPGAGKKAELIAPDASPGRLTKPVSAARVAEARAAAAQLAAVWQEAKETGRIPAAADAFVQSNQTLDRIKFLASNPQNTVQDTGLLGRSSFSTRRSDPVVVVPYARGYDLGCQPIRSTVKIWGRPGEVVNQDPDRRNWGADVPPGQYRSLTLHKTWQTCFLLSPDPAEPVFVFNQMIGAGTSTPRR